MIIAITWSLLGLLIGVSCFVVVPWTLAFLGGVGFRDRVGRYFIRQMMIVLGDGALIARKQAGVELSSVSFDPQFGADRVSVDGETGHLEDSLSLKSRLAGKQFGIGLETHPVYISPLIAEMAAAASDAKHDNRIGARADGGAKLDFTLPETPTVPDLRGSYRILDGDARREFGVLAESWAKKSQEKFGQRLSMGQTLLLMAAFGVGSGMAIVTARYGGPSGGGGSVTGNSTEVPIHLALTLVGLA